MDAAPIWVTSEVLHHGTTYPAGCFAELKVVCSILFILDFIFCQTSIVKDLFSGNDA
jgi:hypothetical protein